MGVDGEEFPLVELGISCKFGSVAELSAYKNKQLFSSEQSRKMMKLSWLGAEGLGREGRAASARHSLPVVPQWAGEAAFAAGGVRPAPEVSAKASWAAQKSLFPQNTTALTGHQTRLLMGLTQSQIL